MTPATVTPDVTQEIVRLHGDVMLGARKTLDVAIRIGELLDQQRKVVGHGEWLPWIRANLPFSQQTASNYMRLHSERDFLRAKLPNVGNLATAYKLLAETDSARPARARTSAPPQPRPDPIDAEVVEPSKNRFDDPEASGVHTAASTANQDSENDNTRPPRGSYNDWTAIRDACEKIKELVASIQDRLPDKPNVIPCRNLLRSVANEVEVQIRRIIQ